MVPFLVIHWGCSVPPLDEAVMFEPYLPDAERIESVPVYGGTMETAPGIGGVVAADPEGNRLLRLMGKEVIEIDLGDNARPFRVHVEGTRAWVTLRGTGELALIALDTGHIEWTTRVCLEPRGVARSPHGPLVVACAGGELVEVDDDGQLVRLAVLDVDLRDVVAADDVLLVSRFAAATILVIDPENLVETGRMDLADNGGVALRMRPYERSEGLLDQWPDPGALVLHQVTNCEMIELPSDVEEVDTGDESAAYGSDDDGPCFGTILETNLTFAGRYGIDPVLGLAAVTAATDFVITKDGDVAIANAGADEDDGDVLHFQFDIGWFHTMAANEVVHLTTEGRASALALDDKGSLVMQSAAPLSLQRANASDVLLEVAPDETADVVRLFQADPGVGVSCASCHPEGLDDGEVWTFVTGGTPPFSRRTMPLAGQILSRQPYHWDAAHEDPHALMEDTFVQRMGGSVEPEETTALFDWLDGLRHVRAHPAAPESAVAIGRTAFATAACDDCHAGSVFTTNERAFVGNGTTWIKIPSLLGVGVRNHLLHDGCAYDLDGRFGFDCGGLEMPRDAHGVVSRLTADEIEALKAYLRTL